MSTQVDAVRKLKYFEYTPNGTHGEHGVFVVGCADTYRNTVLSQQHRALTLVNAMRAAERLKPGQTVGIVGGGVAGVTAAMQCVEHGANVQLFEKSQEVLSLFAQAYHRWLHPGLFNWPSPGWDVDDTHKLPRPLPHLNWKFDSAANVAKRMKDEFAAFCVHHQNNGDGKPWIDISNIGKSFQFVEDWNGIEKPRIRDDQNNTHDFEHLIVAVGFGVEETLGGKSKSYWKRDDFSDLCAQPDTNKYLVVGCGDGGLFDCLRLCLNIQDERWIVNHFLKVKPQTWASIEDDIKAIEARGGRDHPTQAIADKNKEWAARADDLFKFLISQKPNGADRWRRRDTQVTLVGQGCDPINGKAAPINRFLIALLKRLEPSAFTWNQGKFTHSASRWQIEGTKPLRSSQFKGELVLRLGPHSALEKFSPKIWRFARGTTVDGMPTGILTNLSQLDSHSSFLTFDGNDPAPKVSTAPQTFSKASAAAYEETHIREEVVHENPYLLGGQFCGREKEQADFTAWLKDPSDARRMLCVCDYGGAGKTALVWHWLNKYETRNIRAELGYREYWATFYAQDYGWMRFVEGLARRLGATMPQALDDAEGWRKTFNDIMAALKEQRWLIVLDGLEREMESYTSDANQHMDNEEQEARKERGAVRMDEKYFESRLFAGFLKGLLATQTKLLVTSRMMPEDFRDGRRLCAGVEEYEFQAMSAEDAMKVWKANTDKPGSTARLKKFFQLIGHHPQVISIVAAALESSDTSNFGEWLNNTKPDAKNKAFKSKELKTTLRHRWLELATSDLVTKKSKAWMLLCFVIARSNATNLDNLIASQVRADGTSPFRKEAELIQTILELQGRKLLGYDGSRRVLDIHPVVRSHVAKYIIGVWKSGSPDEFGREILENLHKGSQPRDAFLKLLSTSNLDDAAKELDESDADGQGDVSYAQSFDWMKEFYPGKGTKPWLDRLPHVSLRKLQASVLSKTARAASALGDWDDATILHRRAKLAYRLCGELEKAEDCQRGEDWQLLYGGSLAECEREFLRRMQSRTPAETDIYWLAMSLSIRASKWAKPLLKKIAPGQTRWMTQATAEAYYYLENYRKAIELLKPLEKDSEPAHPIQQLWERVTFGMAKLKLKDYPDAGRYLNAAQEDSKGFQYRIVRLFSHSSLAELKLAQAREEKAAGNESARLTSLDEAKALFERTIRMDKKKRFQIPMVEATLGSAKVELAFENRDQALAQALESLRIALGKHAGFAYAAGVRHGKDFLKKYFRTVVLPKVKRVSQPDWLRRHHQALDRFMKNYLKTGGTK